MAIFLKSHISVQLSYWWDVLVLYGCVFLISSSDAESTFKWPNRVGQSAVWNIIDCLPADLGEAADSVGEIRWTSPIPWLTSYWNVPAWYIGVCHT